MVFDDIHFSYGTINILRGVFLKVRPSSICGLYGRNGSGKSTLIKIGVGMLKPFSGNVFINDVCVTAQKGANRFEKIAYLSQDSFLPRDLTIEKILRVCNVHHLLLSDEVIKPLLKQRVNDVSGGEKRYLELRIVLALDRSYYLLDEPFTGAAPILIEKMMYMIIAKKNEGKGVLLTDHYSRYVKAVVDEMWILEDGYCHPEKSPAKDGA